VSNKKDGYDVGYGKPPAQRRFAKGQSGNPKGRPKGSRNFSTIVRKEFRRRIAISENGLRKHTTKIEAFAKQLVNKGVAGDPKFAPMALAEIHRQEGAIEQAAAALPVDRPEDQLTIANIIRRIRDADELNPAIDRDASSPADNTGSDGEQT
jgi:hypothetical protein